MGVFALPEMMSVKNLLSIALEIKLSAMARGFESHPLRQKTLENAEFSRVFYSLKCSKNAVKLHKEL